MYEYDRAEARPMVSERRQSNSGTIAIANLLAAGILGAICLRYEINAMATVIVVGTYYGTTTPVFLLIESGTLTELLRIWIDGRVRLSVGSNQPSDDRPFVESLPTPREQTKLSSTYVPAADDGVQREALAWAVTLFGRDGQPHPDKVNMKGATEAPGRLKTAAPSNPAVKQYLLDRKVLVRIKNGYKLHLGRCPSAAELRENLR